MATRTNDAEGERTSADTKTRDKRLELLLLDPKQDSADKARTLLELLETVSDQADAASHFDFEEEDTITDEDDDGADYMEDDGTFSVDGEDDKGEGKMIEEPEVPEPTKDGLASEPAEVVAGYDIPATMSYTPAVAEALKPPAPTGDSARKHEIALSELIGLHGQRAQPGSRTTRPPMLLEQAAALASFPRVTTGRSHSGQVADDGPLRGRPAFAAAAGAARPAGIASRRRADSSDYWSSASSSLERPPPFSYFFGRGRLSNLKSRKVKARVGLMGRVKATALNLSRRLVQYLETSDLSDGETGESGDDLAFGDIHDGDRKLKTAREMPRPSSPPPPSSPLAGPFHTFVVLPPAELPRPAAIKLGAAPRGRRKQPRPPGEFETLLRTKIFKPAVQLTTSLPEPLWTGPAPPGTSCLFTEPPGEPMVSRKLTPLGEFVAQRDRALRETLKEVELGVGGSAGGFGLDFSTKGILALLKPVQWINTWRSVDREVHVNPRLLAPFSPPPGNPGDDGKEKENPPVPTATRSGGGSTSTANRDPGHQGTELVQQDLLLHRIDNELMSSVKYQYGESQYITVITFSEVSGGDRVDSGAITLFRVSAFAPQSKQTQATKLDLEARFQDIPGPICRILARQGNPNRFELRRDGKSLSVRERGKVAPLRPGTVKVVVGRKSKEKEAEKEKEEKAFQEWVKIGGGWRRALHILLDHTSLSRGGVTAVHGRNTSHEEGKRQEEEEEGEDDCSNEGLIATIPQMLALLHLRYRTVDCIPSTPVLNFSPPLKCEDIAGTGRPGYVRRGVKLLGPPIGATHVGSTGTVAVLFSKESRWVREQLFWA